MLNGKKESSFLDEHAGKGLEGMTQEDIKTPFLRIMQPLTPQLSKIPGAKVGMFYNTATSKLYGQEINLIPLEMKRLWLEWLPNRGGLVGIHEPHSIKVDTTEFSSWKYNGNIVQDNYMYYCLVEGHLEDGLIVFALQSTGIKHARNWNTLLSYRRTPSGNKAPIFSTVWNLKTIEVTNAQGTWYQIGDKSSEITPKRYIKPDEFEKFVKPIREAIAQLSSNTDYSQLEDKTEEKQNIDSVDY